MRVFSLILTALICYAFLSSGIYLTKTHREASVKIAQQEELARQEFERKEAERIKQEKIYNARLKKIVHDIKRVNKRISNENAIKIAKAFIKYGKTFNIRINRLLQIASVESRFNPKAVNKVSGDYGLMQINWRVWGRRFVKHPNELLNIDTNVKLACYIISHNKRIGFKKVAHYHSFNPERVEIYEEKLEPFANRFAWSY